MTEERFVYQIRQRLNRGLDQISPGALRRLEAARHHALAHQKAAACTLALAGVRGLPEIGVFLGERGRQLMAVLLLLLGLAVAVYWQGHQYVSDLEDVDSALLADSIPPDAFLDKGFAAWLDDSSGD